MAESKCCFFETCGPSGINGFVLKETREIGGKEFRQRYCFGDPSGCVFFAIRKTPDKKEKNEQ